MKSVYIRRIADTNDNSTRRRSNRRQRVKVNKVVRKVVKRKVVNRRGKHMTLSRVREFIILRQRGDCNVCKEPLQSFAGKIPLYDIDHIIPKCNGGSNDAINLQAICLPCHRRKTSMEIYN